MALRRVRPVKAISRSNGDALSATSIASSNPTWVRASGVIVRLAMANTYSATVSRNFDSAVRRCRVIPGVDQEFSERIPAIMVAAPRSARTEWSRRARAHATRLTRDARPR